MVSESLASPALLEIDIKDLAHCAGDVSVGCFQTSDCIAQGTGGPCIGDAPQCGPTCTTLIADVQTDPDVTGGALNELLSAPGQPISLDASGSSGTCLDGSLQYRIAFRLPRCPSPPQREHPDRAGIRAPPLRPARGSACSGPSSA